MSNSATSIFNLLIVGEKTRITHLKKFASELEKLHVKCMVVNDLEYIDKSTEINLLKKSQKNKKIKELLKNFKPNAVLLDRLSKFGQIIIKEQIPLLILLRGNYWEESSYVKEEISENFVKKMSFDKHQKIAEEIFSKAHIILPISKYLESIVLAKYPKKNIRLFHADGRDSSEWFREKGMELKHPCVGLLQGANIWGKTKELAILPEILEKLPDVHFYWAGDGVYKDKVLPLLEKYENFHWLGSLEYPDKVREFLTEIDVYLLLTGLEGLGQTVIEASLMKKPIIATNVGGIPDLVKDGNTGCLIKLGDSKDAISKISFLLKNNSEGVIFGENAYNFVKENFSWSKIALDFSRIMTKHSDLFITKKRNNNL